MSIIEENERKDKEFNEENKYKANANLSENHNRIEDMLSPTIDEDEKIIINKPSLSIIKDINKGKFDTNNNTMGKSAIQHDSYSRITTKLYFDCIE